MRLPKAEMVVQCSSKRQSGPKWGSGRWRVDIEPQRVSPAVRQATRNPVVNRVFVDATLFGWGQPEDIRWRRQGRLRVLCPHIAQQFAE